MREHPRLRCKECGTLVAGMNMVGAFRGGSKTVPYNLGIVQLVCSECEHVVWSEIPLVSAADITCRECGGGISWGAGRVILD